ncbi:MAG TPA: hypothetical protein VN896_12000 [Methylomirabilota bacterium]|jgi:hypothetical protein|nr:hypothetical protein [Methylomirabilota bacterium]
MPRYLVEVPHESEKIACARAAKELLELGSHFVSHADFGCLDGDHRAWIIVEGDDKAEVRNILPPPYRAGARITGLNKFTIREMDQLLQSHGA